MSRPPISVPLPLPLNFTILPTLAPGSNLCPLLYSLINDIPIYLTLSPSHQPHFSLLPLFLCITPPLPPLHIFTGLSLKQGDYSLDINGLAPFVDIWVPWHIARTVCGRMKVGHLFWDDNHPARGLLGERTREIVTWDEIDAFGHNWLPSTTSIPGASYSMATLISTPFSSVSLIPGDNCIYTKMDRERRAMIRNLAEDYDHSQIRLGQWETIWECLARWNVIAWEAYRRHPSTPPRDRPGDRSHSNDLAAIIHNLLPALARMSALPPTYMATIRDLESLLPPPTATSTGIKSTFIQLVKVSWSLALQIALSLPIPLLPTLSHYVAFLRLQSPGSEEDDIRQRQLHARLNIAFVEALSQLLIGAWRLDRERTRLAALLGGGNPGMNVIVPSTPIKQGGESHLRAPSPSEESKRRREKKAKRRGVIEELERRRGGSPSTDSDRTPQQRHIPRMRSPLEQSLISPPSEPESPAEAGPSEGKPKTGERVPSETNSGDLSQTPPPLLTGWSPPEGEPTDALPVYHMQPQSAGLSDSDSDAITPLQRTATSAAMQRSPRTRPPGLGPTTSLDDIVSAVPPSLIRHRSEEDNDADREDDGEDLPPLQRSPRARRAGHGHRRSLSISISSQESVTPSALGSAASGDAERPRHEAQREGDDCGSHLPAHLRQEEHIDDIKTNDGSHEMTEQGSEIRLMKSEGKDWLYVYLSIIASIGLAVILGMYQR